MERHFRKMAAMFLIATPLVMGSTAASANLITNGGFETGDLTGWTCTGADSCLASVFTPRTGTFAMEGYDNSGFATLAQTISTSAGASYSFEFWSFASRLDAGNILRYSLDGAAAVTVATTTAYAMFSDSFTATGATATIEFFFETDSGTGTWNIDDVDVSAAVPEPSTLALLGLSLVGIGLSRRTRKA